MRYFTLAIFFQLFLAVHAFGAKYTIQLGDQPGFSDGKSTYSLGMNADDFKKAFGSPDKERPAQIRQNLTILDYQADGFIAEVRGGVVVAFDFYLTGYDGSSIGEPKYESFDATTDKGVGADATKREIIKALGDPASVRDDPKVNDSDDDKTTMEYWKCELKLTNGRLKEIFVGDDR
jgi:hypothetical protein